MFDSEIQELIALFEKMASSTSEASKTAVSTKERELEIRSRLLKSSITYDDLINELASTMASYELMEEAYETANQICEGYELIITTSSKAVRTLIESHEHALDEQIRIAMQSINSALMMGAQLDRSKRASHAANARHSQQGGSRETRDKIRKIWMSGKYTSRDRCAEEECGALGISFSAARKALRNTPDPTPST